MGSYYPQPPSTYIGFTISTGAPTPPTSFFLQKRQPPGSTLFPYTTLFRSSWPSPQLGQRPAAPASSGLGFADRKSTRLNSSHQIISYAVFCLKKKRRGINAIRHKLNPLGTINVTRRDRERKTVDSTVKNKA